MQKQRCDWCNELAVSATKERGGGGFVGDTHVRANDNEYFVEYVCDACGKWHGYRIEPIEGDSEDVEMANIECPRCGGGLIPDEYIEGDGRMICDNHCGYTEG